ncbi:HAD-IC family P-type ATPase [Faecalibacillus intestinalis]|uniref:HAD-IC family P-type ATPase n=1 Tax=Faecalibacillus intestinalis TaxID=1982626 RepID=UPI003520DE99
MKIFDREFSGLSQEDVLKRQQLGKTHFVESKTTKTYKEIIFNNIFTFFNLINILLFACLVFVGSYRNTLFISVIFFNTLTGSYQEIKAKRTLDQLSILTKQQIDVLRDNQLSKINVDEIVQDDLIILNTGMQIPVDCELLEGHIEANESLLTGESDAILKVNGDSLLSGSFVTSGRAICKVIHVGKESYIHKLTAQAKEFESKKSELSKSIDQILKIISVIIIPLSILLFFKEYFIGHYPFSDVVVSVVAAVLGMIPSGLVLLTTIALSLSVLRLAKKNTLVQNLFCIETLARVDTICLDKTGTLTEGKLKVDDVICFDDHFSIDQIIKNMNYCLEDGNMTSIALHQYFSKEKNYQPFFVIPFSSQRKYSAVSFNEFGTVYLGASQFIFENLDSKIEKKIKTYASQGFRVLCIGYTPIIINDNTLIKDLKCIGILILSDVIRQDAKTTLDYFKRQDVDIKIISGDDPVTVSAIARRCHLLNYEHYIDVSSLSDEQIKEAIEKYTIFGRVSPKQKQLMVNALQENNHTVAMTGDGVNDVLALKAADCSIAMASGSDAAKSASHIVLLKNNFNAMPHIVNEGRRVINNITASASMYLIKTIFSVVLSIGMILFGHGYPFKPIQLTVISACCVGIPTFFLTYEPNFKRVSSDFLKTVFKNAFPFAFMIAICSTIIVNGGRVLGLEKEMLSTICVLLTSWCYYNGLRHIYSPLSHYRIFVIYIMQIVLYISLIVGHQFLGLGNIDYIGAITLMFLVTFSKIIYLLNFELFDYTYLFLQRKRNKHK